MLNKAHRDFFLWCRSIFGICDLCTLHCYKLRVSIYYEVWPPDLLLEHLPLLSNSSNYIPCD